jgi:hypothetical protein
MYTGGYVQLVRKFLEHPIFTQCGPPVLKVAIYCLLRANWKPMPWYDGSRTELIPPGSFITSIDHTAQDCGLSKAQIRRAFGHIEKTHFATFRATHKWTLVTILDYATYKHAARVESTLASTVENIGEEHTPRHERVTKRATNEEGNHVRSKNTPPGGVGGTARSGKRNRSQGTDEQADWFAEWWPEYWRHVDKKAAHTAFCKFVTTPAVFQAVMQATKAQKPAMLTKEEQYRPHGATWLNGERWQDEVVAPAKASTTRPVNPITTSTLYVPPKREDL